MKPNFPSFKKLPLSQKIPLIFILLILFLLPFNIYSSFRPIKLYQKAAETQSSSSTPLGGGSSSTSRVFITSLSYSGNLGGLSGADSKCQERANAASLGGNWKAWLSSDTESAADRIRQTGARFVRIDGVPVAESWEELLSGQLKNPINITELRTPNCTPWVWTNTNAHGEIRQTSRNSCQNWTSETDGGGTGDSTHSDSGWTDYGASACYYRRPVYCFEQTTQQNPVNWRTNSVSLQADDFYITANGEKYFARVNPISIQSDPGNSTYTTLELIWQERNKEMRLFIYFNANEREWWSPEIRTYNGRDPADWIFYTGGYFFRSPLGQQYSAPEWNLYSDINNPELNNIHFKNLRIQAFLNYRQTSPTPTLSPTNTPSPTPSSPTCSQLGNSTLDQQSTNTYIAQGINTNWGTGEPLTFTPNRNGKLDKIALSLSYEISGENIQVKVTDLAGNNLTEIITQKVTALKTTYPEGQWQVFDFVEEPLIKTGNTYIISFRQTQNTDKSKIYVHRGNFWNWGKKIYIKPCLN